MTKTSAVSVAVVGMGYWGKNLVRNFHDLGALRLICDGALERQTQIENLYPGVGFVTDYAAVLQNPAIAAVVLATPAVMHFEMAQAALLAGKDVYVEKPLALDVQEGQQLVDLAKANGRILMIGHILQYHPAVIKLQELIRKGVLGQIQYVYSNRLNIGKIRTEENILWSFAPHDISMILALLGELPREVACQGGSYLSQNVADVTVSQFVFPSGVRGHIFVNWLHPFKEQRLVVVGSKQMAVFDDTSEKKLVLYHHQVEWNNRVPTAIKAEGEAVPLEMQEPLKAECLHFLDCVESRQTPRTDGAEGLRVLRVLDACEKSLGSGGVVVKLKAAPEKTEPGPTLPYFVHEKACVDSGVVIGTGSKIWHFSHIMKGAKLGERCIVGQNVNIDGGTTLGNNVKIQNNVSIYTGTIIEDDVFLGPSCVLTNVTNPRSQISRHSLYEKTLIRRGATVGANATIVCGVTLGRYCFIAAGAVVTKDIPDYALVMGNPARQTGWMSRHGHLLKNPDKAGIMICPESGFRYQATLPHPQSKASPTLHCLDIDEEVALPDSLRTGTKTYDELKSKN